MHLFISMLGASLISTLLTACQTNNISFQKVADTYTLIPNGRGSFTSFDGPYVHKGKVVFRGYGNNSQAGVYTNLYGKLIAVADKNTPIPQGQGNFVNFGAPIPPHDQAVYSDYLNYNAPALDQNSIVFLAAGSANQKGNYLYRNHVLKRVADKHIQIPKGISTFKEFDSAYLNAGKVTFSGSGINKQQGIYEYNDENQQIRMLYNNKTPVPNGQRNFSALWNPSFDNGHTAFRGSGINKQEGVYSDAEGQLKMIADKHTPVPNGQGNFISLGAPSLQNGKVAFWGFGNDKQQGIYTNLTGTLTAIVNNETILPEGRGQFYQTSNPTIDNGNIVFEAADTERGYGIYLWSKNRLFTILKSGSELEGKMVKHVALGPVGLSQDKVACHVTFTDNSQGIYTAKINSLAD